MLSKHISGSCQQNPLYRDGLKQTCTSASLIEEYYCHLPHYFFSFNFEDFNPSYFNATGGEGQEPTAGKQRWRVGAPLPALMRRLPRARVSSSSSLPLGRGRASASGKEGREPNW